MPFNQTSVGRLAAVHPDLARVAYRALAISPIEFAVVQGSRTQDEQDHLYGHGRSASQCVAAGIPASYAQPDKAKVTWTRRSNHIGGRAIDVCPVVGGSLCWDDNGKRGLWPKLAAAFKQAAKELDVTISWGGDWQKTKDRPHFELPRK